ncbi:MAG TPA: efflux RND transporter permease subunit, partial [Vicinamibacterales bacterium]|nr:efflux RND transporter permease subunit [Vicinamibacterales bacterium]
GDAAKTRNLGNIYVRLKPIDARRRDQFTVMTAIRNEVLPPFAANLRTSVQPIANIGGGGSQNADIQFIINGADLAKLDAYSKQLVARVKKLPGVVDVDTSMNAGKPEMSVRVDRPKAADLGVQIADAAEALRLLVGGDQVTTYNEAGEQYEVHLRAQQADRSTQQAVAALTVPSSRLGAVSLDNVANFTPGSAPSDINRLNRQRQVTVFANLLPNASQAAVQNAMVDEFNAMHAGPDYRGAMAGRSKELGRAAQNFILAFVLSLVFMYLILAAQFESWLHPITILLSLPLTLPFALLSIIIFRQSLNILSALGLLVLFGVVKKNSILQIDHANQLKDTGLTTRDAIVQASRDRLRPILMTTFAFVAGMIPLITSRGIGSGTNHAIGFVVFGGQSLALVLTLLVTPVAYSLFDDLQQRIFKRKPVQVPAMAKTVTTALLILAFAATSVSAQTPAASTAAPLRLTVDEAVQMALDHNPDLSADRLDPQISDTRVAAAAGAFRPAVSSSVNRNNQIQPPSSFLIPTPTQTDAVTSSAGLSQRLPKFGTSYSVSFSAVHTDTNSFLTSYNPLLTSGLSLAVSQPLVRDLAIDSARQQLKTSRINRDIAGTRLRESLVHTTANVKSAYWNLAAAIANVGARQSALDLAQELTRVNKAKVDVGQSPPLDLLSAQAEVASDEEQLIIAQTAVREAEDRLRVLIFDPADRSMWNTPLEPIDSPPVATLTPDLDAAVTRALDTRADLARAKKDIENANVGVKFADNQKLPDVRFNLGYTASGLGGTQILRDTSTGFPGIIVGPGLVTPFGTVLNQLFAHNYPTWTAGVSVTYPLGGSTEDAAAARARLERQQSQERLKSSESRAIQQVRDAGWKIDMNAKRIATTRAARELAEQRLDVERKRFDVGLSTSFFVIQAQRDLAQAKAAELNAVLQYDLALVDFEALQEAGPAAAQAAPAAASAQPQQQAPAAAAAPATTTARPAAGTSLFGF